jgi:hypothetical protein
VDKIERHNTRENRIISIFTARKYSALAIFCCLVVVSGLFALSYSFYSLTAASENVAEQTFGVIETTNIFPTNVSASRWSDLDEALSQDLPDYALFQDFDSDNSSFLGEEQAGGEVLEVHADGTQPEAPAENSGAEAATEETGPTIETEAEDAPSEPVSYLETMFDVTKQALAFPLAQLSFTSSTPETETPNITNEAGSVGTEPTEVTEGSATEDAQGETGDVSSEMTEGAPQEEVEQLPEQNQLPNDIKITNFKTASLEPGQFVDSIQLRLSLAAQANVGADGSLPYIDVLFKGSSEDSFRSVGSILIDGEVSNAINGGYYLFALPTVTDPELLEGVEVMLRVKGTNEQISSIKLDAVWLELNARSVTPEDLEERTSIDQFTHLEPPKITTLVSEDLNFAIDEAPVFNLRYESQQNFVVRGFMKLLGRDELAVKAISVNHQSIGHIEITPEVTIAGDGLVTIELPGEDLDVMRPGLYEINMLFEENGSEYVETFDFQWGMLTINPNKTSYETGESALISMGALSPNGNTLCEENLALYITSPNQTVTKVPVEQSGKCNGNNITDVPDYTALYETTEAGEYKLYLERLDETGGVLSFTTETFLVTEDVTYSIERNGPTRIYPPASYPMSITISAKNGFNGQLVERVPKSFSVGSTSASIVEDAEWQILSWDISLSAGESITVSYGFDAPDISPYIYRVGEASLEKVRVQSPEVPQSVATSTDSASTTDTVVFDVASSEEREIVFAEHRQWQIASDAVGSLILMWDGPVIPAGWTCISCNVTDVFYQRYIICLLYTSPSPRDH